MDSTATALPAVLAGGVQVATAVGPYVGVALAFVFGPRLLRWGIGLIKGR